MTADIPLLWQSRSRTSVKKCAGRLTTRELRTAAAMLGSGYLIQVWRATDQGKLPVLWLVGRAVADSTRIIAR